MSHQDFEKLKNFYQHRLALNYGDDSNKETPEYWDSVAESFAQKVHSPQERKKTEDFLNKFLWGKGETVLDVASGPGTFAIPLAHRGCKVTATDFSPEMLNQLKLQAQKENCPDIKCIKGRWLEINLEDKFDTVLCMNGLGVISTDSNHKANLGATLERLYSLANKRLIVFIPHADSLLTPEMQEIIGISEPPVERLRIALIYYAMVDHRMLPSLQIIKRTYSKKFQSLDEVCEMYVKKCGINNLSADTYEKLKEYIINNLLTCISEQEYILHYTVHQALYIIEK